MTPDDARILAEIKDLEARTARLEKKLRGVTSPVKTATTAAVVQPPTEKTYRKTLAASPTDPTLHDAFTEAPHSSALEKAAWDNTTQEVIQSRKRKTFAENYASLSQRLEAMEAAIQSGQGIALSDNSGNSVTGVTGLEFAGALVSGTTPLGVVTLTGGPTSHSHIWDEVPSGAVDGLNGNYALLHAPLFNNSVIVRINGLEQKYGTDYNVVGQSLHLFEPPYVQDILWVTYII